MTRVLLKFNQTSLFYLGPSLTITEAGPLATRTAFLDRCASTVTMENIAMFLKVYCIALILFTGLVTAIKSNQHTAEEGVVGWLLVQCWWGGHCGESLKIVSLSL